MPDLEFKLMAELGPLRRLSTSFFGNRGEKKKKKKLKKEGRTKREEPRQQLQIYATHQLAAS